MWIRAANKLLYEKKYMENEDSCNVCPKDGGSSAGGTHVLSSLSLLFLSPQLPVLSTPGDHSYSLSLSYLHTRSLYPSASASCDPKICVRQENFWNSTRVNEYPDQQARGILLKCNYFRVRPHTLHFYNVRRCSSP